MTEAQKITEAGRSSSEKGNTGNIILTEGTDRLIVYPISSSWSSGSDPRNEWVIWQYSLEKAKQLGYRFPTYKITDGAWMVVVDENVSLINTTLPEGLVNHGIVLQLNNESLYFMDWDGLNKTHGLVPNDIYKLLTASTT